MKYISFMGFLFLAIMPQSELQHSGGHRASDQHGIAYNISFGQSWWGADFKTTGSTGSTTHGTEQKPSAEEAMGQLLEGNLDMEI